MRIADAMTYALREFARADCGLCRGRGMRGGSGAGDLCRCVTARLGDAPASARSDQGEMPHPWPVITRRAQEIHAAATVDAAPDVWG